MNVKQCGVSLMLVRAAECGTLCLCVEMNLTVSTHIDLRSCVTTGGDVDGNASVSLNANENLIKL